MRQVLCFLLQAYQLVLLAHVVLSWVPRPPEPILPLVRGVRALVEPVVAPIRARVPALQLGGVGLDVSILLLFLVVYLLQLAIC